MKTFNLLAALSFFVVSATEYSLEDIYGPAPKVERMAPISQITRSRALRPANYYSRRSAERCDFPLEILLVQDLTASFNDNFDAMVNDQLPKMFSALGASHPDSTYGAVTFRDKPIAPFGTPATDYCQQIDVDFTANTTAITEFYAPLRRVGGGDPSENQFGALIAALQTDELSWASHAESTKLIVLATDAPPHFEGDGANTLGMLPSTGVFRDDTAAQDCLKYYYPSPDQVLASIKGADSYFATLVYDPAYWNGLPAKSWKWFNRFLGQTDDFANLAANDQSDFWVKLSAIIQYIENLECEEETTTPTPAPTATPVGSTQPPPTTLAPPPTGECAETIICEDDVLIKIGFPPDNLNVVVDGKQIA